MARKPPIKLKHGCLKLLAEDCEANELTVRLALRWDNDTELQNRIRERAKELGYIKKF